MRGFLLCNIRATPIQLKIFKNVTMLKKKFVQYFDFVFFVYIFEANNFRKLYSTYETDIRNNNNKPFNTFTTMKKITSKSVSSMNMFDLIKAASAETSKIASAATNLALINTAMLGAYKENATEEKPKNGTQSETDGKKPNDSSKKQTRANTNSEPKTKSFDETWGYIAPKMRELNLTLTDCDTFYTLECAESDVEVRKANTWKVRKSAIAMGFTWVQDDQTDKGVGHYVISKAQFDAVCA